MTKYGRIKICLLLIIIAFGFPAYPDLENTGSSPDQRKDLRINELDRSDWEDFIESISNLIVSDSSVAAASGAVGKGKISEPCSCGQVVTSGCILTEDLLCEGIGLIAGADDIVIDGNGHTIRGNGGSEDEPFAGIMVQGQHNVTVRNFGLITNFYIGVLVVNSTGASVQNNLIKENWISGVILIESSGNLVIHNTITDNVSVATFYWTGIALYLSDGNLVSDNYVNENIPGYGLVLSNSLSNNIQNNDFYSNRFGIYVIDGSDHNYLADNSAEYSVDGIFIDNSDHNRLIGNRADYNWTGLTINNSEGNFLRSNSFNHNNLNLTVRPRIEDGQVALETLDHNIDSSNLVQDEPVYYLRDSRDLTLDRLVTGPIGIIYCISCDNVEIKNYEFPGHNYADIVLVESRNIGISNNISSKSSQGIYLVGSHDSVIENNLFRNIGGQDYHFYAYAINSEPGVSNDNNLIRGNLVEDCKRDFYIEGTSRFEENQFLFTKESGMIFYQDTGRILHLGERVEFSGWINSLSGEPFAGNTITVRTSPEEPVNLTIWDVNFGGDFVVSRPGYYSLIIEAKDSAGNYSKKYYPYYVDASGLARTRYYMRGVPPENGQPMGTDARALLFSAPERVETWSCSWWILNSVDEIPDYPFSILTGVDFNTWYRVEGTGRFGIQRNVTYWVTVDRGILVPESLDFNFINASITDLNWDLSYPKDWYQIAVKFDGRNGIGSFPHWQTRPESPSYVEFTHLYTTTPAVKALSDYERFHLLSATASFSDPEDALIVIVGEGSGEIKLNNYHRPFRDYQTTLDSEGGAIIHLKGISGETGIQPVKMEIRPLSGEVSVKIAVWDTGDSDYRKWTEKPGRKTTVVCAHRMGDLAPNTEYLVKANHRLIGRFISSPAGEISFSYQLEEPSTIFEISR